MPRLSEHTPQHLILLLATFIPIPVLIVYLLILPSLLTCTSTILLLYYTYRSFILLYIISYHYLQPQRIPKQDSQSAENHCPPVVCCIDTGHCWVQCQVWSPGAGYCNQQLHWMCSLRRVPLVYQQVQIHFHWIPSSILFYSEVLEVPLSSLVSLKEDIISASLLIFAKLGQKRITYNYSNLFNTKLVWY